MVTLNMQSLLSSSFFTVFTFSVFTLKMPAIARDTSDINGSFEIYIEGWLARTESLLDELIRVRETWNASMPEAEIRDLVALALSHFEEYYEEKFRVVRRNVYAAFSPAWLTPFERAMLWITGFNPEILLDMAVNSTDDLTDDQLNTIQRLVRQTQEQVRLLNRDLARVQENVVSLPIVDLVLQEGRRPMLGGVPRVTGEVPMFLRLDMENLVVNADAFRRRVINEVVGILSPIQNVRFFAAVSEHRLRLRRFGRFARPRDAP